jgi:membrane-associated phospholipid phosphatase
MKKKRYPLIHYSFPFSRFLDITRTRWFFLLITAFCIFSYFFLDKPIALEMRNLDPHLIAFAEFMTLFGKGFFYYIALILLYIFFKFIRKSREWANHAAFLFIAISVPGFLCNLLKMILGRARPILLYTEQLYGFTFFQTNAVYLSFPSGHSVLITSLMIGLCFIFKRYWAAFVLIALLISATRVIVGAHYLSDIMAGMYLAIMLVPIIYRYTRYIQSFAYFFSTLKKQANMQNNAPSSDHKQKRIQK